MAVTSVPAARIVTSPEDRAEMLRMMEQSLASGSLTLGPNTEELEAAFAKRHGAGHAVAVSSGTSALEIILRSLDVAGRQVVVPANTFFATAAAVLHAGGRPRFADVSASTLALSAASLEAAFTDDTAGVVLVHIGGLVTPDIDEIVGLCRRRGIFLVEDAAHAHGASYDGRHAGQFGVAAALSFYPTKVMTTGEGGMILTDEERLRDEARVYRDQGKAGFFGGEHVRLGYAWRMSELHAAVGVVQERRLDDFIATRRHTAAYYDDALRAVEGVTVLPEPAGCVSNYYKYVALLHPGIDRQAVKREAKQRGLSMSGEVYARPLHIEPVFAEVPHGPLPVAEDVCARHICLPVHSDMTEEEAAFVVDTLGAAITAARTSNTS